MREAEKFFDVSAHVYAHRGLWSGDIPENSLAAFQSSRNSRIGVELDVRLTTDVVPIVFHDATLDRLCSDARRIDEISAKELERILLPNGALIPTLDQALDVMEGLPVLLELKVDITGDVRIADITAKHLKDRGGTLAVMSFDEMTVARLCHLIEDRPIGLLIDAEPRVGADAIAAKAAKARAMGCDYLAPHLSSLGAVSHYAGGLPLVTWTVRSPDDLQVARNHGAAPIFEGFSPSLAASLAKPDGTPI